MVVKVTACSTLILIYSNPPSHSQIPISPFLQVRDGKARELWNPADIFIAHTFAQ